MRKNSQEIILKKCFYYINLIQFLPNIHEYLFLNHFHFHLLFLPGNIFNHCVYLLCLYFFLLIKFQINSLSLTNFSFLSILLIIITFLICFITLFFLLYHLNFNLLFHLLTFFIFFIFFF